MIVFLEVTPKWPTSADPILVCSAADRRAQSWDAKRWAAALFDPGTLSVSLFSGEIGTIIESDGSPVVIAEQALLELFPDAEDVRWESAAFAMWAGEFTSAPGGSYPYANTVAQIAKGKVSRFEKDAGQIKLTLDPAGDGETKVLVREYAGSGNAEGGTSLKGTLKPWIFGHAQNVEPVLINEDNSVYQFSGYGPIQSVDALYERGASFGASFGNYANYAALVAAAIPAGRWATCLAEGLIRLGAPQYGVITGDVKGDYAGSVQRRYPGAILQRIALERGIASLDTDSLDALDAFALTLPDDGYMNIVLKEQTTFLELARRIAAPYNAQAGFSLMGDLFASRVGIGTPSFTIDSRGRRMPLVGGFVEADTPPPYKRIIMTYGTSWRVNDLATEVAFYAEPRPAGDYSASETYREGDVVTVSDGSTWLYINPVASSGNSPPLWPVESNTYWTYLTKPLNRGKLFVQPNAPTEAESSFDDLWQDADGRIWKRREDIHLSVGGNRITVGGNLLTTIWTPNDTQPVIDAREEAAEAQADAIAAAASAAAANAELADIASDSLLTPGEKPRVIQDRDVILAEQAGIDAGATALGITTEKTTYDTAVSALTTYLATLTTPVLWSSLTGNTTIVGATFRTKFGDVYAARQALLDKVAAEAAKRAQWADIGGTGKPQDNADVTANSQVVVVPAPTFTLYRTSAGAVKADQLPADLRPAVTKGGADIRTDNSVSYSVTGYGGLAGKVTVNNTNGSSGKGDVTLANTITGEGYFELSVTVGGVPVGVYQTQVVTVDDLPPINNGGAGGTDTTLATITSTTYAAMTGQDAADPVLDVAITSGQVLKLNANFKYQHTPSNATGTPLAMKCKGQYYNGSTWLDMDSATTEVTGSASTAGAPEDRVKGEMIATFEKSGLAAGTYPVRLMGKFNSSATGNLQVQSGGATSFKT